MSGQAQDLEGLGRDTGGQPCFGSLRECDDLAAKDARLSLGKYAQRNYRFDLNEQDTHVLDLMTGTRADVKLVGNPFIIQTEIHDERVEEKQATARECATVAAIGAAVAPLDAPPGGQRRDQPWS